LRLLLTALVLGGPTFLMGGTCPQRQEHREPGGSSRRRIGLSTGSTRSGRSWMRVLEFPPARGVGTRLTLWMACLINLLVAVAARAASRRLTGRRAARRPRARADWRNAAGGAVPSWFVLVASCIAGFAFFLMELVWYRMLAPILGGTVFTFGLVLAIALFGSDSEACSIRLRTQRAATSRRSRDCLFEAIFVALPYALGDRVATLALWAPAPRVDALRRSRFGLVDRDHGLGPSPSFGQACNSPAHRAFGRGQDRVGIQTGLAYAANTGGAIAGASPVVSGSFRRCRCPGAGDWSLGRSPASDSSPGRGSFAPGGPGSSPSPRSSPSFSSGECSRRKDRRRSGDTVPSASVASLPAQRPPPTSTANG